MKGSILAWKIGNAAAAAAIVSLAVYFSLKTRIEQEHGPGSWEEWLKATPEVESGTYHASTAAPQKPRNLKARFWTGVPRIADRSVVRLDRHGYSVGYSKRYARPVWVSTYLTGRSPGATSEAQPPILKKWKDDVPDVKTTSPSSQTASPADTTPNLPKWLSWLLGGGAGSSSSPSPLPRGYSRGHFVSPELMGRAYGWTEDSWFNSNQLTAPSQFCSTTWPSLLKLAETYSKIYGGLVLYLVPIYEGSSPHPSHVAMVMVRPSAKGPVSLSLLVSTTATQSSDNPEELLTSAAEIEAQSGVYLFADLPAEWRKYLLHPSQNTLWPTGS